MQQKEPRLKLLLRSQHKLSRALTSFLVIYHAKSFNFSVFEPGFTVTHYISPRLSEFNLSLRLPVSLSRLEIIQMIIDTKRSFRAQQANHTPHELEIGTAKFHCGPSVLMCSSWLMLTAGKLHRDVRAARILRRLFYDRSGIGTRCRGGSPVLVAERSRVREGSHSRGEQDRPGS